MGPRRACDFPESPRTSGPPSSIVKILGQPARLCTSISSRTATATPIKTLGLARSRVNLSTRGKLFGVRTFPSRENKGRNWGGGVLHNVISIALLSVPHTVRKYDEIKPSPCARVKHLLSRVPDNFPHVQDFLTKSV